LTGCSLACSNVAAVAAACRSAEEIAVIVQHVRSLPRRISLSPLKTRSSAAPIPRSILQVPFSRFKRELARLRKEGNRARRRLLRELQDVERGIKRCLNFITGGDGNAGSVRDELRRLEARKRDIDADLMARNDSEGIVLHPNLPELYRNKVAKLQEALQHQATRPRLLRPSVRLSIGSRFCPVRRAAIARSLSSVHWLKSCSSAKKRPPPH
jgi:hypothetical protein